MVITEYASDGDAEGERDECECTKRVRCGVDVFVEVGCDSDER